MTTQPHDKPRTQIWSAMAPILAGLALGFTPMIATAQEQQPLDEDQEQDLADIERIVVTGSRLMTNPNIEAPNPVLSVGSEEIEARGTVRIASRTRSSRMPRRAIWSSTIASRRVLNSGMSIMRLRPCPPPPVSAFAARGFHLG